MAEVPTSTKSMPAALKTGFAPSIRGWMLPVPGVAMMPATRSPELRCGTPCSRMWVATAAPAVRFDWPT